MATLCNCLPMEALWNWALDKVRKYWNLSDNLRSLERKVDKLSARRCDFELQVGNLGNPESSGTKKRKADIEIWFEEVAETENGFRELKTRIERGGFLQNAFSSGDRVAKMDGEVDRLLGQSDNGRLLENFKSRGELRVTTKLSGEKFHGDLKAISECLVKDNSISKIGIYGMGGVGKTTLAEHINDHLLKNTQFKVYWITVSQEFSIERLQDDIAKHLGLDLSKVGDEKVRATKLRVAFEKEEEIIVLILDDVWDGLDLEMLGNPLDAGKRNPRWILTTRSLDACNRTKCEKEFHLETLGPNEAWDLFKYTLGSENLLQGDVEGIAKSVAERCARLPLAIITMAGSMRGVTTIERWRNALEQLPACSVEQNDEMEENVFRILKWSFDCLDECHRYCFLYCSLYPEDSEIGREELVDLFIWAELMPKQKSRSAESDKGHAILEKLINVSLLEESKAFRGKCVKMHDLVREMALRITNGNSELMLSDVPRFLVKSLRSSDSEVITLEQKEWTENLHAVSFQTFDKFSSGGKRIDVPPDWSPNCPKLSTLLLYRFGIKRIPDSFFQHMCGLKVLNLNFCSGITELPNSVSNLVHLTALILRLCMDLRSMPPLGKLKQLRELDLSSTKIEDLPQGLESLSSIESLKLGGCRSFKQKIIPKGTFSELHRLQCLELPYYGNVQVNVREVLNQLKSFIGCLSVTNYNGITRWPEYYSVCITDNFSSSLDDHNPSSHICDLKQLLFYQCKLGRGLLLPIDLKSLELKECVGRGIRCLSDAFKNFTSLNDLYSLEIRGMDGIEFLWQIFPPAPRDQLVDSSFSALRSLQELTLKRLPDLVGLFFGESETYLLPPGTFSFLTRLVICLCHNMKQLFTMQLLQNLQNLEYLEIWKCGGLEEIAADDNGVGQGGGEGIQLTSSKATATFILPKLRCLYLSRLPQLKNICKAAMIRGSIEKIHMFGSPNVKRLPLFLPTINGLPAPPSTLLEIKGDKEWWESLEWDNPCAKNALDPFFTTEL